MPAGAERWHQGEGQGKTHPLPFGGPQPGQHPEQRPSQDAVTSLTRELQSGAGLIASHLPGPTSGVAEAACHDWCCLLCHGSFPSPPNAEILVFAAGFLLNRQGKAEAPPPICRHISSDFSIPALPASVSCLPLVWAWCTAVQSGLLHYPALMLQLLCSPCLPQPDASVSASRLSAVLCLLQAPSPANSVGGGFLAGADRPLQRGSPPSPPTVRKPPRHTCSLSPQLTCHSCGPKLPGPVYPPCPHQLIA